MVYHLPTIFPVSENGCTPYWNLTSGFDLNLFIITGIAFCIDVLNFIQIGQCTAELWRHIGFLTRHYGSHRVGNLLSVLVVAIYLHTKFRWYISIRGWVITTYGFEIVLPNLIKIGLNVRWSYDVHIRLRLINSPCIYRYEVNPD